MRVRLIRKLAEMIDGVDLSRHETGAILDVSPAEARLLVAEQWAIPEGRAGSRGEQPRQYMSRSATRGQARELSVAADRVLRAPTAVSAARSKRRPKPLLG
jgi:hypothetical protein